jgi:uncharacterized protein
LRLNVGFLLKEGIGFSREFTFDEPEVRVADDLTISDDVHLDLTPVVREDFLLSIPMHALCQPDCKGLCPQCGANWNEGPCDCRDEQIDPRMQVLAQLLQTRDKEPPTD